MQKFRPCLWFDGQAEEAANYYVSIFKNSRVRNVSRFTEEVAAAAGQPAGQVMAVIFELDGQEFMGLNGGPLFKFTEAISIMVDCKTQEEVDYFWEKLSAGGETSSCGWLKDRYGLSWQIVPSILSEYLTQKDPAKTMRAMSAVLQMGKLEISKIRQAVEQ
jgi:predicted 3-demethylubiquinone-9 3-methyltransferase (glyoxalase superfamily)